MKAYYEALGQFDALNVEHEMAVRSAFQHLLQKCGGQFHWTLVPEFSLARKNQAAIRVDGALLDDFKLKRGFWEAKDGKDDLEKEVKKKIAAGYPTDNIIFQAPKRAILYQNGVRHLAGTQSHLPLEEKYHPKSSLCCKVLITSIIYCIVCTFHGGIFRI